MKKALGAGLMALSLAAVGLATDAQAETKIGMITTLSGGGSHLGIDVRDGFLLAMKQSGRTDVEAMVKDDARKPDIAKALADEFIQKDKVDILTGIIFSNLAMAVVPASVRQGTFYLSPNAGRQLWPVRAAMRTISTSLGRTTICTKRWAAT